MARNFPNIIDAYLRLVENSEPPRIYCKWAIVSVIAGCLQRKCYVEFETRMYPNFYILLVGKPAVRKGTALKPAFELLKDLSVPIAKEAGSKEALLKRMANAATTVMDKAGGITTHSSLTIWSQEFAVFLNGQDEKFVANLADWFDCADTWSYETIGRGLQEVNGLWINLIGAITPELLAGLFPKNVVGSGLTSRIIFVFADSGYKRVALGIWSAEELALRAKILQDLECLLSLQGRFVLTSAAMDRYCEWYMLEAPKTDIKDRNFENYNGRRAVHLRKLMMIMSAAKRDDMTITLEDFDDALSMLYEVELEMPRVFGGFGRKDIAEYYPQLIGFLARKEECFFGEVLSCFYKDLAKDELEMMIITLESMGTVKTERVEVDGTSKAKIIFVGGGI